MDQIIQLARDVSFQLQREIKIHRPLKPYLWTLIFKEALMPEPKDYTRNRQTVQRIVEEANEIPANLTTGKQVLLDYARKKDKVRVNLREPALQDPHGESGDLQFKAAAARKR